MNVVKNYNIYLISGVNNSKQFYLVTKQVYKHFIEKLIL